MLTCALQNLVLKMGDDAVVGFGFDGGVAHVKSLLVM
jgi:hypothetical protein